MDLGTVKRYNNKNNVVVKRINILIDPRSDFSLNQKFEKLQAFL
jgi:hypothetical protein